MKPAPVAAFYRSADHARRNFHISVPNDTLVADVLKPHFWINAAPQVAKDTLIDVVSEDGLLDMTVRVDRVVDGMVFVHPRIIYEDKERRAPILAALATEPGKDTASPVAQPDPPEGYKIGWNPGSKTYYVQLKLTGKKVKEGIQSRPEAIAYSVKHAALLDTPAPKVQKVA